MLNIDAVDTFLSFLHTYSEYSQNQPKNKADEIKLQSELLNIDNIITFAYQNKDYLEDCERPLLFEFCTHLITTPLLCHRSGLDVLKTIIEHDATGYLSFIVMLIEKENYAMAYNCLTLIRTSLVSTSIPGNAETQQERKTWLEKIIQACRSHAQKLNVNLDKYSHLSKNNSNANYPLIFVLYDITQEPRCLSFALAKQQISAFLDSNTVPLNEHSPQWILLLGCAYLRYGQPELAIEQLTQLQKNQLSEDDYIKRCQTLFLAYCVTKGALCKEASTLLEHMAKAPRVSDLGKFYCLYATYLTASLKQNFKTYSSHQKTASAKLVLQLFFQALEYATPQAMPIIYSNLATFYFIGYPNFPTGHAKQCFQYLQKSIELTKALPRDEEHHATLVNSYKISLLLLSNVSLFSQEETTQHLQQYTTDFYQLNQQLFKEFSSNYPLLKQIYDEIEAEQNRLSALNQNTPLDALLNKKTAVIEALIATQIHIEYLENAAPAAIRPSYINIYNHLDPILSDFLTPDNDINILLQTIKIISFKAAKLPPFLIDAAKIFFTASIENGETLLNTALNTALQQADFLTIYQLIQRTKEAGFDHKLDLPNLKNSCLQLSGIQEHEICAQLEGIKQSKEKKLTDLASKITQTRTFLTSNPSVIIWVSLDENCYFQPETGVHLFQNNPPVKNALCIELTLNSVLYHHYLLTYYNENQKNDNALQHLPPILANPKELDATILFNALNLLKKNKQYDEIINVPETSLQTIQEKNLLRLYKGIALFQRYTQNREKNVADKKQAIEYLHKKIDSEQLTILHQNIRYFHLCLAYKDDASTNEQLITTCRAFIQFLLSNHPKNEQEILGNTYTKLINALIAKKTPYQEILAECKLAQQHLLSVLSDKPREQGEYLTIIYRNTLAALLDQNAPDDDITICLSMLLNFCQENGHVMHALQQQFQALENKISVQKLYNSLIQQTEFHVTIKTPVPVIEKQKDGSSNTAENTASPIVETPEKTLPDLSVPVVTDVPTKKPGTQITTPIIEKPQPCLQQTSPSPQKNHVPIRPKKTKQQKNHWQKISKKIEEIVPKKLPTPFDLKKIDWPALKNPSEKLPEKKQSAATQFWNTGESNNHSSSHSTQSTSSPTITPPPLVVEQVKQPEQIMKINAPFFMPSNEIEIARIHLTYAIKNLDEAIINEKKNVPRNYFNIATLHHRIAHLYHMEPDNHVKTRVQYQLAILNYGRAQHCQNCSKQQRKKIKSIIHGIKDNIQDLENTFLPKPDKRFTY